MQRRRARPRQGRGKQPAYLGEHGFNHALARIVGALAKKFGGPLTVRFGDTLQVLGGALAAAMRVELEL